MKNKEVLSHEMGKIFSNGLFYKNPVLVGALGLYPVVAAGYSLKNAVELSILFIFISIPISLLFCFVGEVMPLWIRPGIVLIASAVFYLPGAWLTNIIIPNSIAGLGMFASLMICNSMILSRTNDYAPTHIGWAVIADAVGCSLGFSLVICMSAAIRGFLLNGGHRNTNIAAYGTSNTGVALPFFGFILLGFFAAFVQWVNERRNRKAMKGRSTQV